MSMKDLFN